MPSIVVLIKHVPDTWSTKSLEPDFSLDRVNVDNILDEVNEYAVEQALRAKESLGEGWQVIAATMGPAADEALRKALSMGADEAIRLSDDALAGSDAIATAWALNNLLNAAEADSTASDIKLIVAGRASSDGETGLVPGLLAEYRQIPALTNLKDVVYEASQVTGTRVDARGTWQLQAPLPAIVTVSDQADTPRFPNFKKIKAAKSHEIKVYDLASIGVNENQVGGDNSSTRVTAATEIPARTAGEVIQGGADPEAAAVAIADFLAARNLL